MSSLDNHRKAAPENLEIFPLSPPFSFFDFIEDRFGNYNSIRRIFSLARASKTETLVLETIPPEGIIAEENEDIRRLFSSHTCTGLYRISFWKNRIDAGDFDGLSSSDLTGYAILKRDEIPDKSVNQWHVFEAVFTKYPHEHNCVPRPQSYRLTVGGQSFEISGLLYCQQNELNKACAQVALRSLLSRVLPEGDISYRRINEIAARIVPGFMPGKGLSVPQIRQVLLDLGLRFNDVDYSDLDEDLRQRLPYQKYAYAGLEAGGGALVGFRLAGRELQEEARHIIPIYGHTFNKDTWVPDAEISYFRIGEGVGYVPSESWTSSFLGHDDNFGANFCIPRLYIEKEKVDYVVEIFRPGVVYSGVLAEAFSLDILYSLLPNLSSGTPNKWILRLKEWTARQQVVFRAQALTREEYVGHLRSLRDWEGNAEQLEICELMADEMPEYIWVVEISTPQLFPANERKLGEIVFDATQKLNLEDESSIYSVFSFARLPGMYLFGGDVHNGTPQFTPVSSRLKSHTDLIKL